MLLTNRLSEPVEGAVWSLVRASGIGSLTDSTLFQAGSPRRVALPPGGSRLMFFAFIVPATVRNGSNSCVETFFGENALVPFFNTVGHRDLFCIQKGFTGALTVLSEKQSQGVLREVEKAEKGARSRREDE